MIEILELILELADFDLLLLHVLQFNLNGPLGNLIAVSIGDTFA